MAVEMFLKVDGIEGESQIAESAIDILTWSWGMSQSGTMHEGTGGGGGKLAVQDVTVTKYVDASSNALMLKCCNFKPIPNVKLTVRKGGGEPLEYITLTMQDVVVSHISTGGSGEDRLTENVTFNFAKFRYAYTPQQTQTGTGGAAKECNWDIAGNVAM
jgi:type VI secretion system secreted protein Hcp